MTNWTAESPRSPIRSRSSRIGLRQFVEAFADEQPPLLLGSADLTIKDPDGVRRRFGAVFNYLTRVEFEVERNVLELRALMPDATETVRPPSGPR